MFLIFPKNEIFSNSYNLPKSNRFIFLYLLKNLGKNSIFYYFLFYEFLFF